MTNRLTFLVLFTLVSVYTFGQEVLPLYKGKAPGSEKWDWKEQEVYHEMTKQRLVYNVVDPTLTVYKPVAGKSNGTAVIIAPGGGFQILSIDNEGINVAKWLAEQGVTAFVLKYRVKRSYTSDPFMEMMQAIQKGGDTATASAIQMGIQDGVAAVRFVREHAAAYGIDPKKIGIMGFSAGGTVTVGAILLSAQDNRPDFAAPIYAYTGAFPNLEVPANAPPIFIAAASDDQLMLAPHSVDLYSKWIRSGKSAELHMYVKGGHGFGIRTQGQPSDQWAAQFGQWLKFQGLLK